MQTMIKFQALVILSLVSSTSCTFLQGQTPRKAMADPKMSALSEATKMLEAPISLKKSMGADEFKNAISDLMKIGSLGLTKAEFDDTPFGGSVQKLKDLISAMLPEVEDAHAANKEELDTLAKDVQICHDTKDEQVVSAKPADDNYKKFSPEHVSCRNTEDGLFKDKTSCWEDEDDKKKVRDLRCQEFALIDEKFTSQNENMIVVTKGGQESSESYLKRISQTICGQPGGGGKGEYGEGGFLDEYLLAKEACELATKQHADQKTACETDDIEHANQMQKCNNIQDQMDHAACKYAVDIKDSCEEYAECYNAAFEAYESTEKAVQIEVNDRQTEWKDLKRMLCVVDTFSDGKVEDSEVQICKEQDPDVSHLEMDYPTVKPMDECDTPKEYPTTAEYKEAQFQILPQDAKGQEGANECSGLQEIPTGPREGSPDTCACERVTLNGPYSSGPLVKCVNCLDVRRTVDVISCPEGTKLFSPRSRSDWKTFIASAQALDAPDFIVDVTSPKNGCGGCAAHAMNSDVAEQNMWGTQDGSPWFMRSEKFSHPSADGQSAYQANCYLSVNSPTDEDDITFQDDACSFHAKSYYCQLEAISLTPKEGSPQGCVCEQVELAGSYTGGALLKCTGCSDVRKSEDKNSCPEGTKIFSPSSRSDWKTFIASASKMGNPDWIIDITRPQNGCGGCSDNAMESGTAAQATWVTADRSPWWLRAEKFDEPASNYEANCYFRMVEAASENGVKFQTDGCNVHSDAYFCQRAKKYLKPK